MVFLTDLGQRRDRGRVNGTVGHIEPPVLLPSSQPHHELRVYGLSGDIVVVAMGRSSCVGVLGELLVHSRAGVLLGSVRRAVRGGGRFRWAIVSKSPPRVLVDGLPVVVLPLRGKQKTWLQAEI